MTTDRPGKNGVAGFGACTGRETRRRASSMVYFDAVDWSSQSGLSLAQAAVQLGFTGKKTMLCAFCVKVVAMTLFLFSFFWKL